MADPSDMSWWFGGSTPQNSQYQDRDMIMSQIQRGLSSNPNQGIVNQQAPQMQAAQAGPAAQAQAAHMQMGADPFRAGQLQQMRQLQGVASGQQMGAGELAVQRQMANAAAQQQAMARMQRGGGAGLAYRNAANQTAANGLSAAGMGQQAALQDQQNAQQQLLSSLGQGRQGDIGVAGQNAGFQQQTGLANAGFQQQTGLANAGFQQGANQYNTGMQGQTQQLNNQNYIQLLAQLGNMDANQLQAQQAAGQNKGMMGPLLSAGGTVGAAIASDERLKTDVTDAGGEVDEMLDALLPKAYVYKDSKHGVGRRVGIMAQDMLRSEAGARIVRSEPEGLMLDVNKALSAALASSARLNERVRKLEATR